MQTSAAIHQHVKIKKFSVCYQGIVGVEKADAPVDRCDVRPDSKIEGPGSDAETLTGQPLTDLKRTQRRHDRHSCDMSIRLARVS